MNTEGANPLSVHFQPRYWNTVRAAILVSFHSPVGAICMSIFPFAGVAMIVLFIVKQHLPDTNEVAFTLMALLFPIFVPMLQTALMRWRNPMFRGPFTYSFVDEGVFCTTPLSNSAIKWPAFRKAVQTKNFLVLLLAGRSGGIFIPREAWNQIDLSSLRSLITSKISKVKGFPNS
jgi:hypothetical protein